MGRKRGCESGNRIAPILSMGLAGMRSCRKAQRRKLFKLACFLERLAGLSVSTNEPKYSRRMAGDRSERLPL
ncbi:hypothetical protein D3C86_1679680 [compost metagenome]